MDNYLKPSVIPEHGIYDCFHNDFNKLILIQHGHCKEVCVSLLNSLNEQLVFQIILCPHKNTRVYVLDNVTFSKDVILLINSVKMEIVINKYSSFENELIMSTMVKDEDAYIVQWIEFHRRFGVSRFIIYDNSDVFTLGTLLDSYIRDKIVVLFRWSLKLSLCPPCGCTFAQQPAQQNHSLYVYKTSSYIGFMDVDEYINIQNGSSQLQSLFDTIIHINMINLSECSGFQLLNKFFFNPYNKPTTGLNFLKIYNCNPISVRGHEKVFVIPQTTQMFSVHMVTLGKPMLQIPSSDCFFNHYYFLNKKDRGINLTQFVDDSMLRHIKDV